MGEFYLVIAGIALVGAVAGLLAGWAMKNGRVGIIKGILWGFVVFWGCFTFPLWSDYSLLKVYDLALFVLSYYTIGKAASNYYQKENWKRVCLLSVGMPILGMVCRFFLEYGEVSNTYNFTPVNIILYAVLASLLIMSSYFFHHKYSERE